MIKLKNLILSIAIVSNVAYSSSKTLKRTIKGNMTEVYHTSLPQVDNFTDMFHKGEFYGRVRLNTFLSNKGEDHHIMGTGGSLIYKSAYLYGFGFTTGFYTSQNSWHMDESDALLYKAGKDVLNRYNVLTRGTYGINSLAQVYLEYKNSNFSAKAGRFIYESFLTKSNDTKMIPNSFQGVALSTNFIPNTEIKMAYLTEQKLRDHEYFHHILAYGDDPTDTYAQYTENDDSAMHKGLTLSALKAQNIEDELIIIEAKNSSIDNLKLNFNYTALPDLVSSAMIQADYKLNIGDLKISPALRYMRQFDDGAGAIGGANLRANTIGYDNPNSLDSALYGAKIDISQDAWKLRFGYTQVADEGDIIAPWRGFPTGGFTRAMAQYNWYANTKTYMIRADYDFDKAGLDYGVKAFMRYAIQDFDDSKVGVQADSHVLTFDILKEIESHPGLYVKTRIAFVNGDDDTIAQDGSLKVDSSYNEIRFEINYLF